MCCLTSSSPIHTSTSIPVIAVTHFKMWAFQLKVGNLRVRRIKEEFASLSADVLMSRRGKLISLGVHAFSSELFSKPFSDSHLLIILFSSYSVHLVFTAGLVWPGQGAHYHTRAYLSSQTRPLNPFLSEKLQVQTLLPGTNSPFWERFSCQTH